MFGRGKSTKTSDKAEPEVKYWRGRRIDDKSAPPSKGKIIEFGPPNDDDDKS